MEFEEIYKEYYKDVYLFLLAMTKNPDTAEEMAQETFFKALKSIHKFKGGCSLKTWLCQIGKNTYLSHLKREEIYQEDNIPEAADPMNVENICIQKSEALSVYKILHCLEEPYKEVFILRVLGDLSFQEIGQVFERKEGWARVTFHRARLKIQSLLKEEV